MIKILTEKGERSIGIPRAMLYYRYHVLWETFFQELGAKVRISPPTNLKIYEAGAGKAIDEMCLSTKIFLGHVEALIGQCDYILIPRISNFGVRRHMCVKFEGLYDLTCNIFRGSGQKFISYNLDVRHGLDEKKAFTDMAAHLGYSLLDANKAYKVAKKAEEEDLKQQIKGQDALYKSEGMKILVAAHSYVIQDPYFGKPVLDYLEKLGVLALRADIIDRKSARKHSKKVSPTLKWEMNREIVGGLYENQKKVDGIILLSVFPCGPDSMVNELLIRKNPGIPILNLMLDGQSGTAGLETRLESFVDILRLKGGTL